MPRKRYTADDPVNHYIGPDGDTVGAYAGTEQDKVYAQDPAYELVGKRRSAAAEPSGEEATQTGEDGGKSQPEETVDLTTLNREQLNALAAERGIEGAEDLPNKGKVIEAIEAAAEPSGEEG